MVSPESKASQESWDNRDCPVVMAPLEPRDRPASRASKDLGEQQDHEDPQEARDPTESSELQEPAESPDFRDLRDPTERRD